MEIHASTYISAKLKIRTYMYEPEMQKHTDCRLTDGAQQHRLSLTRHTDHQHNTTQTHTHTHTQTERDDFAEVSLSHNWSFSMHTLVFIIISTILTILRIKPSVCATVPLRYTHIKHAILLNVLWNEKLHVCNRQIHQGIFYFIIHNNVSSSEKVNLLLLFTSKSTDIFLSWFRHFDFYFNGLKLKTS